MYKKIICTMCILMLIFILLNINAAANVIKKEIGDIQNTSLSDDDLFTLSEVYYVLVRFNDMITMKDVGSIPIRVTTYLATPPNIRNQLRLEAIEYYPPGEFEFLFDEWQNHFAKYVRYINPGGSSLSTWTAKVRLSKITFNIDPDLVTDYIPSEIEDAYFIDAEKYDIYHKTIGSAVAAAIGDETNQYKKAKLIHDYIIFNLDYKIDDGWDSAPVVLERGNGSCSEFSFVFIAMCRRAGIPARYIGGTVYDRDEPVPFVDAYFHRWTQVYLSPYGWVPVDVTFDNTLTGNNPEARDDYFGVTDSRLLATTIAGDDSSILKWGYNARDVTGGEVEDIKRWATWYEYDRQSPEIPGRPIGPDRVRAGERHRYRAVANDPQGEDIEYFFDWGDNTDSGWLGPYKSGDTCFVFHEFVNYFIKYESLVKVKTRDSNGFESDWSEPLVVTVPKSKQLFNRLYPCFWEQILLRFPVFSILLKILN